VRGMLTRVVMACSVVGGLMTRCIDGGHRGADVGGALDTVGRRRLGGFGAVRWF
jgi:hypothetical protein